MKQALAAPSKSGAETITNSGSVSFLRLPYHSLDWIEEKLQDIVVMGDFPFFCLVVYPSFSMWRAEALFFHWTSMDSRILALLFSLGLSPTCGVGWGTEGTGNEFEEASHRRCTASFPTATCGLDGQEQLGCSFGDLEVS